MKLHRQGDLTRAFVSLADTLVAGYDAIDLLQQLVEYCVDLLEVSEAALLLAGSRGALQVAAASSDEMRRLELFQVHAEAGPCLECFTTRAPVIAESPAEMEQRWPVFARAAAAQGLLAVAVVPLRLRADAIGALGMFTDRVPAPDSMEVTIAQGLADVATIGLLQARAIHDSQLISAQLQGALDSRVVLEQAKGVVASQLGISVADAFTVVRSYARQRGERLTDVAASIVAGHVKADQLPGRPPDAAHPHRRHPR